MISPSTIRLKDHLIRATPSDRASIFYHPQKSAARKVAIIKFGREGTGGLQTKARLLFALAMAEDDSAVCRRKGPGGSSIDKRDQQQAAEVRSSQGIFFPHGNVPLDFDVPVVHGVYFTAG
jgi:hypothetical protein